ncbi:NUDIX domain-containing protein [Pseudonocardia sp.]|jgi:8-oxo-dGTP diphosphatase|uniref:NUDIX hydrolase n=1 Tax=Pseudonocardia sp. TaxID=60912 RepID=UPI0031FD306E
MSGIEVGSHHGHLVLHTVRQVHFHDAGAPAATMVTPSVFVAARDEQGALLLVRRCDSGTWELPGGRVDVGESACDAGVRETAEEAGVQVHITGLVGLFTDPGHVVVAPGGGATRQQFVVCLHARAAGGRPWPDGRETSAAAWFDPSAVDALPMEPGTARWIRYALSGASEPHLD